jgi:hypothetical protein
MRRLCHQFELRGGFGCKGLLFGPDLIWHPVRMALPQPRGVIDIGKIGDPLAECLDGREVPDPEQLLLQRPDDSLRHAVALRLTYEGLSIQRRSILSWKVIGEVVGTVAPAEGDQTSREVGRHYAGWMRGPRANRRDDAKYGNKVRRKHRYFKDLTPPYFFRAVRSFGEYEAERDEIWPPSHSGSQELFAKKPANTGYFCRWNFGERDLPRGRMAEGKGLKFNRLWVQVIDFVRSRFS